MDYTVGVLVYSFFTTSLIHIFIWGNNYRDDTVLWIWRLNGIKQMNWKTHQTNKF